MRRTFIYLVAASAWFWAVALLARQTAENGSLGQAVLAAILLLFPALGASLYLETVRIIRAAHVYAEATLLKRIVTSRLLSTVGWSLWSVVFAFFSVFWLASLPHLELYLLYIAALGFYFFHQLFRSLVRGSVKSFFAEALALGLSRRLGSLLVTLAFVLMAFLSEAPADPGPLAETFAQLSTTEPEGTVLVHLLVKLFGYWQALENFTLAQLGSGTGFYLFVTFIVTYSLVHHFLGIFSGFLIPAAEYRRMFTAIDDSEQPAQVAIGTLLVVPAVTVILLALLVSLLAQLEMRLYRDHRDTRSGTLQPIVSQAEQRAAEFAELLDGVAYKQGTVAEIEDLLLERREKYVSVVTSLQQAGDSAFDAMRNNVDVYLDNYYSLSAEYLRILATLSGSLEERIAGELRDTLLDSDEVRYLNTEIAGVGARLEAIDREYNLLIVSVLEANRIDTTPEAGLLFPTSIGSLGELTQPEDAILGLDLRLSAAAGGGLLSTVIVMGIIKKATAKGIFAAWSKVFLKSLSKFLPAIVPAALVAVIPGVGPLILSLLIGTLGTLLIDKAALELEEAYSRDKFRAQILEVIDEQQLEFNALLRGEESRESSDKSAARTGR